MLTQKLLDRFANHASGDLRSSFACARAELVLPASKEWTILSSSANTDEVV